jgi:hypothetical protein
MSLLFALFLTYVPINKQLKSFSNFFALLSHYAFRALIMRGVLMSNVSAGNNTLSRVTCCLRATVWAGLLCAKDAQWVYCDVGTSIRNIT